MTSFKNKRPYTINIPEHSLVPTLKKLEVLDKYSSKLRKLLQACETEKSSLTFEIGMLNRKVTRLGSEKADIKSELMKGILSGKKKQTKKRTKKTGITIPLLKYKERKKSGTKSIYNKNI